jgi:hypothetical protein
MDLPYALRVLAGRDPGIEYPLEDFDREVLIGRADDMDLVLDDVLVSRRHAKIFVEHGQLFIEDLGSTNGVFVNAHRIWLSAIKEGDRLQIGASLLKLVPPRRVDTGPLERTDMFFPPEETAAARQESRFSGKVEEIPLLDLVQLLATSKKSGVLVVRQQAGCGRVYLRAGRAVYASIDEMPAAGPHKALYRMLSWKSGLFELEPEERRAFERELTEAPDALLLEAMRQIDEIARLEGKLPPLDLRVAVAGQTPPLRKLNPDQSEVLKVVFTYGPLGVGELLDRCSTPDLETYLALAHLARAGYIQAVP